MEETRIKRKKYNITNDSEDEVDNDDSNIIDDKEIENIKLIENDWRKFKNIEKKTPGICLFAVKKNGLALEFVQEQTPEICQTAVNTSSEALQFVKNQTTDICLAAVNRDGLALRNMCENKHQKFVYEL
jgi:hypothetical protein